MTFRETDTYHNQAVFRILASGVSQRRCARMLGIDRKTVARKLKKLGAAARALNRSERLTPSPATCVVFDEMETFEHSKCKPLSIAIAVEEGTRRILSAHVARMPAKGRLAEISRRRYGYRKDCRPKALKDLLIQVGQRCPDLQVIKSDQSPRYPSRVRRYLPGARHDTFKGRRGCVVGQGELKRGGHDPLFSLNHTCAMLRDNIKRLSRRTWCTTKDPDRLQDLVDIYTVYHNAAISGVTRLMFIGPGKPDPDKGASSYLSDIHAEYRSPKGGVWEAPAEKFLRGYR